MSETNLKPKDPGRFATLAATLTISFVVLSALPLLLAGGFQTMRNFQARQQAVASQQRIIALEAAHSVSGFVEEMFNTLQASAQTGNASSGTLEGQRLILDKLLSFQSAFREVALLDESGQETIKLSRLSVITPADLTNQANSDLFTQVSQGQRYISSVRIDETTSEPLVTLAVPMTNAFGEFQGVLLAEVNLKFMWDLVDSLEVGQDGLAYVVDQQGDLIAFGDTSRVLRGENLSHLNQVAQFMNRQDPLAKSSTGISTGINETNVAATHVPLGAPDWAVVVELPVREAYESVILELGLSAAAVLLSATLAALVGVYLSRRLAAPLRNLTDTATRIAEGDLELEAPVTGTAEVSRLAGAFNSMTEQLRELIRGLEARSRALETSAEVSRRLSTILDQEQLVAEVVEQVQKAFDYYHVHIYLVDPSTGSGQDLIMAGGTGEAGRALLAGGHRIPQGKGLVGRAADTNEVVLVPDVAQEEGWLPNPLLPDTQSEVAVPIAVGDRVLGVLDVQQDVVGGLDQDDTDLLSSIAGQVAIALQNTRLLAEAQQKADREERVNLIAQRIQSTTTVESAMQVAVRELGRLLEAQETSVRLHAATQPGNGHSDQAPV